MESVTKWKVIHEEAGCADEVDLEKTPPGKIIKEKKREELFQVSIVLLIQERIHLEEDQTSLW